MLRQFVRAPAALPFRCPLIASVLFVPLAVGCSELTTGLMPESANERLAPPLDGSAAAFDRPFFHGAFLGDSESRVDRIDTELSEITYLVGKRPALVKTFHTLGEDFAPGSWFGLLMRKVNDSGSTNFIALDLRYSGAPGSYLLEAINSGAADEMIRRNAQQIRALGFTVLLSPGWEMNGRWNDYAWQGYANGGEAGGPARYVAAFRRIVDIFRREGAVNVKWVFSPNVGNVFTRRATGSSHWNWYGYYYPGDEYVDYLGPHGYNGPSVWGGGYQHFDQMFYGAGADYTLGDMERRYPDKPIIIGEYASEEVAGYDKGEWIRRAYQTMRKRRRIVGAVWFNMSKEADWRINSSGSALNAYRDVIADPNVRHAFGM